VSLCKIQVLKTLKKTTARILIEKCSAPFFRFLLTRTVFTVVFTFIAQHFHFRKLLQAFTQRRVLLDIDGQVEKVFLLGAALNELFFFILKKVEVIGHGAWRRE
jgi:hypothetical protein